MEMWEELKILKEEREGKGIKKERNGIVEIIIMDVGMKDMEGREEVKIMRKGGLKEKIIMMKGKEKE